MRLELESNPSVMSFAETAENVNAVGSQEADKSLKEGIKAAQAGDRAKARISLLRAAELDASNESAWLWLASISEYPEELLVFLKNVLAINPNNPRALEWTAATQSLLAKNLVQRGIDAAEANQPDAAAQYFNQALEHDPDNSMAWLWMASLSDSNEERMAYLEKVLSIDPDNEAANTAIKTVKFEANQKLLTEARNAVVSGNTDIANELIDTILMKTPDSEEAWVLRSHLADSFEEKILAFEQILAINPDNTAARSGLDSLTSILAATTAPAAEETIEDAEASVNAAYEESALEETFVPDRYPTEELKFPDGFSDEVQRDMMSSSNLNADAFAQSLNFNSYELGEEKADEELVTSVEADASDYSEPVEDPANEEDIVEFRADEELLASEAVTSDHYEPNEISEQTPIEFGPADDDSPGFEVSEVEVAEGFDEEVSAEFGADSDVQMAETANSEFAAEEVYPSWDESLAEESVDFSKDAEEVSASNDESGSKSPAAFDEAGDRPAELPLSEESTPMTYETSPQSANPFEETVFASEPENTTPAEMSACPFCTAENEAQVFVCQGCMAMLTLSDLEMLMANKYADKFVLREAVERMELEKSLRDFSESELTMLGIGYLNLRNLQYGYSSLQEASQLNPNNVVLSSQVNALLIRLEEIKKRDENHNGQTKGKTIMVVDDSPTVRKLIAGKLEKSGHNVFCCNDGVEALEKLQDVVPDLVLLDITMPRMDGYQVCKVIRSKESTKDVPVIMISGKDGFFDKVRGRMAGTSSYITKPFGPETLMKTVETYLKNGE